MAVSTRKSFMLSTRILAALLLALGLHTGCSVFGSSLDHFTEGGGGSGPSCSAGQTACDGTCVDTSTSPSNCGSCGNICSTGQVCDLGSCSDSCSGGKTNCDGACVDTTSDPTHCGDCATVCGSNDACSGGSCVTSCGAGETQCGASCVDAQTDDQNCGSCGNACGTGKKCTAGSCVVSCTTGQTLCDGACVDTSTSQNHCGGCGNACNTGEQCTDGSCKIACPGTQTECSGLCYDLLNDDKNCGACGNACNTGEKCGNGQCALNCPSGQDACGSSCVDLQTNSANCGTCGTACGTNEECSAGKCVIACKTLLNGTPIDDKAGYFWDGLERAATTFDTAKTTCEGIGGRLPTASELYRVSATQSATVGQTSNTNYLWSLVPYNATTTFRVRLSDASVSTQASTGSLNYRCVCPPPLPNAYVGGNCNGPVGTACYALDGEGKRYNVDMKDRAPLSKGGAIWECTFYRGHLARPIQLAEAIKQGIGTGSGVWLHTADQVRYDLGALVSWNDPTKWVMQYTGAVNAMSWGAETNLRPFRCVGVNYDAGTHPATVSDEFVGPLSGYKGETKDSPGAAWAAAQDACLNRGGHLPTPAELTELIRQGLPGGSNAWLWTSDQTGWNGTNFLAAISRWTGTDPAHQHAYNGDLTWQYRTTTASPYRCIYYPIDASYQGPSACNGSCFVVTLPGSSGAKMWFDSLDRAPSTTLTNAVDVCRKEGGHVATERDLTEAIRQGLPNGNGANWVLTSDAELGSTTTSAMRFGVVKWAGTDKAFTDQYSTYSTWVDATTADPYRCMWTNELR